MLFSTARLCAPLILFCALIGNSIPGIADEEFRPLFNGKNLDGWQRVNTAESTWKVKDGMLICSGKPIGELRTTRMYENFILEVEWRHMKPRGNAGIFVWADDITAKGVPFHRSIEVQVLENAYGNTRGYTTHGDIFPIHGAKMTPVNGRGGSRAFPIENRSNPSPQWNHYRIECRDGNVTLAVNHKVVTRGKDCNPRKGYICLESEGGIVHYRNLRIKELKSNPELDPALVAISDRGFKSLYNGIDLKGWTVDGTWNPADWELKLKGSGSIRRKIESAQAMIVDFKTTSSGPTIQFAGLIANFDQGPLRKKLAKLGGWNRVEIYAKTNDSKAKVIVNGDQQPLTETSKLSEEFMEISASMDTVVANIYLK